MDKNVLFFINAMNDKFYAAELEQMKKEIEQGNNVYILDCNGSFKSPCGFLYNKKLIRCMYCIFQRENGLKILQLEDKVHRIKLNLKEIESQHIIEYQYTNIEELKGITFNGYDIGSGVASVLITHTRNPEIKIDESMRKVVDLYLKELQLFGWYAEDIVDSYEISKIYMFNGRIPFHRLLMRIGQRRKIAIRVIEEGATNRYLMTKDTYPHDINAIKILINDAWASDTTEDKDKLARDYYRARRNAKLDAGANFTKMQDIGNVPAMDVKKLNVAIFISSEDEMATIEEHKNHLFETQAEGLKMIFDYFSGNNNFHFYIRVHPNLIGVNNSQTEFLKLVENENVTVIEANSPVSTYGLIDKSDLTIVFGSTVGIEACHNKKPVILAGRADWEDLEGFIKPKTTFELLEEIYKFNVMKYDLQKEYVSSLKYAWYLQRGGCEYKYFYKDEKFKISYIAQGRFIPKKIFNVIANIKFKRESKASHSRGF